MTTTREFPIQDIYDILDLQAGDKKLTSEDRQLLLAAVYENLHSAKVMAPSNLELLISEDCNLRCDYCFELLKNPKMMSPEVGVQSVDFLLRECGDTKDLAILFFGGEPLLGFHTIRAIVEYADKTVADTNRNIFYTMTTNGTLITEEIGEFCRDHKIGMLLSIDGLPDVHDAHRKTRTGKGSYALIEKNLPIIFKYFGRPQVRVTPYPDTADKLVESINHLLELGFDNFIVGAAHGIDWPEREYAIFNLAMEQIIELAFDSKDRVPRFRLETISSPPRRVGWGCRAGGGYITVGADGRLGACSLIMGLPGIGDKYILGDIKEGFASNPPLRQEFLLIQSQRLQKCLQCDVKEFCCGGCPGNNYKATGSILHPAPEVCREVRSRLAHQKLWHYYQQKYAGMRVWQLSED